MTTSETTPGSAPLSLTLFGPMQVRVQGRALPRPRSRKTLWLLALLTLRQGRPVEREWLAGTLWPEVDQSQAFANLRPIISELRHALVGERMRLQSPNRHTLLLDLTDAVVDVLAFDAAIADGSLPALEQAAALYHGPLLEGCPEEWVGQERRARELHYLQALQKMADAALAAGDYDTATAYYRRAAGIAPLWDVTRRGWMESLARSGNINDALQVYREFIALLKNDPKALPDEKTSALYQRLREVARQQSGAPTKDKVVGGDSSRKRTAVGYLLDAATELVGRDDECLEVVEALRRSRLVTLTGVGGIGKTRLAIAVGTKTRSDYAAGVWLVALEALSDGEQVLRQIASILGVREAQRRSLRQVVTDHLRDRQLLLILDNCEHLIDASARVAGQLLQECANLRILATSREAMGIQGERAWSVPALAVPDLERLPKGLATARRVLLAYESIQLFVDRAQEARETFALTLGNARVVGQICARLEGIPLAIELAAAQIRAMTVEQMAALLQEHHPVGLLTGGSRTALSRQQTLRATLDWSFALLSEPEGTLLRRLSVFAGGWTLEAAEAVCTGEGIEATRVLDLLTSLVDKSLILFGEGDPYAEGRFRQLEMVRQYGAEKLEESGETLTVKARHREWLVALAEEAERQLVGTEQAAWLHRLDTEHDNLRATLAWDGAGALEETSPLRLAGALCRFWHVRGYISEGREHLGRALSQEAARARTAARAKALDGMGALAYRQGDYASALAWHEEGLTIRRELGDQAGVAEALNNLGNVAYDQGDYSAARALFEESLHIRREMQDREGVAWSLNSLGNIAHPRGRYTVARSLYEESLGLFQEIGDRRGAARTLCCLAYVAFDQGDISQARRLFKEGLETFRELEDGGGIAWALSCLGYVAFEEGDYAAAQTWLEKGNRLFLELGDRRGVAWTLNSLGNIAQRQARYTDARSLHDESLNIRRELGDKQGIAWSLLCLGNAMHPQGENAAARSLIAESLILFHKLEDVKGMAGSLMGLADVMLSLAEVRLTVQIWAIAQALRDSIGTPLSPYERERHEQQVKRVRLAIGAEEFALAWEEGSAFPGEQAIEYVLKTQT